MSNYTKSTNFATKDNLSPGDPLKIVRGTEIDTEFNNISTAISTKTDNSAAAITGGSITGITDLAIADGGTGASTATAALNNLLPSQTSAANKYLQSDGTNASWDAVTLSTADITGTLPVANGGTGITSLGSGIATFLGTPSSANLIAAVTDETGTGALVFANTPTLVAPNLGTPNSLVGTNITGTATSFTASNVTTNANLTGDVTSVGNATTLTNAPVIAKVLTGYVSGAGTVAATDSILQAIQKLNGNDATNANLTGMVTSVGNATTVVTNANLTGAVTSSGNATSLGSFTSAQLLGALTDETGTGSAVFANTPTLIAPLLGTPTSGNFSTGTFTWPTFNQNTTGTAAGLSATLATTSGGTGLTSFTSGGVVYASSSSALATGSALTFDGSRLITGYNSSVGTAYKPNVQVKGASPFSASNYGAYGVISSNNEMLGFFGEYSGSENSLWISADPDNLRGSSSVVFSVDASEGMRLTSTGLGIGTSSPAYKLQVVGTTPTVAITANNISSSSTSTLLYRNVDGNGNTYDVASIAGQTAGNGGYGTLIFSTAFNTANTERMRIDTSGNLGLGVTPSAWGSGITAFQLAKDTSVSSHTTGGNIFINSNTYYNGSNWIYSATRAASQYQQNNGNHVWYIGASGTAGNAISFTQAMTLDASGNLGVGATSPSFRLEVRDTADAVIALVKSGANSLRFLSTSSGGVINQVDNNPLAFHTNNTERARIDSSGNLLVGTTSTSPATGGVAILQGTIGGLNVSHDTGVASGSAYMYFTYAGTSIGTITQSGTTAVLYNVTSDQRLKENIQDADSASSLIDSLQVRKFDWKTDQTHQRYGFIAQELVTVAPEAVHQPVDADDMMAVDYSKLVPMLVKEIQSLRQRLSAANL
jgi:hypothetical protein